MDENMKFTKFKNFKHRQVGVFIQRQMTEVLHCTLRFHFGQAYLKLDPKNTLQIGANFVTFML